MAATAYSYVMRDFNVLCIFTSTWFAFLFAHVSVSCGYALVFSLLAKPISKDFESVFFVFLLFAWVI